MTKRVATVRTALLGLPLCATTSVGCGIGVVGIGERTSETDHFSLTKADGESVHHYRLDQDGVIRLWGAPSERRTEGLTETWFYRRELAFSGMVVFVVVPIPLLVPIGYRHTYLVFEQGALVRGGVEFGGMVWGGALYCDWLLPKNPYYDTCVLGSPFRELPPRRELPPPYGWQ